MDATGLLQSIFGSQRERDAFVLSPVFLFVCNLTLPMARLSLDPRSSGLDLQSHKVLIGRSRVQIQ